MLLWIPLLTSWLSSSPSSYLDLSLLCLQLLHHPAHLVMMMKTMRMMLVAVMVIEIIVVVVMMMVSVNDPPI